MHKRKAITRPHSTDRRPTESVAVMEAMEPRLLLCSGTISELVIACGIDYDEPDQTGTEYAVSMEVHGNDLAGLEVVAPWDTFVSAEHIPAVWDGSEFQLEEDGFWFEGGTKDGERWLSLGKDRLTDDEWSAVQSGSDFQFTFYCTHGDWTGTIDFSSVSIPNQEPVLINPVHGQTNVSLSAELQWEPFQYSSLADDVIHINIIDETDDERYELDLLDPYETSWTPQEPFAFEPSKDYQVELAFANTAYVPVNGVDVLVVGFAESDHYFTTTSSAYSPVIFDNGLVQGTINDVSDPQTGVVGVLVSDNDLTDNVTTVELDKTFLRYAYEGCEGTPLPTGLPLLVEVTLPSAQQVGAEYFDIQLSDEQVRNDTCTAWSNFEMFLFNPTGPLDVDALNTPAPNSGDFFTELENMEMGGRFSGGLWPNDGRFHTLFQSTDEPLTLRVWLQENPLTFLIAETPGNPAPDLTFAEPAELFIETETESAVFVPVEVLNIGTGAASNVPVALYLSSDDEVTTNDTWVAGYEVGVLPAGGSYTEQLIFLSPDLPGIYTLAAVADPNGLIPESDETNNWSLQITLEVKEPSQVEAFAFADFFPMNPGFVRNYFTSVKSPTSLLPVSGITWTVFAPGSDGSAGNETYELQKFHNGRHTASTYYSFSDGGLMLHGLNQRNGAAWGHTSFSQAFMMCPAQIFTGQSFAQNGIWGDEAGKWTGTYSQELDVLGFEEILVPAGTYNALKLRFTVQATKTGSNVDVMYNDQYTAWLVQGLGVVMQQGTWAETPAGKAQKVWGFDYRLASAGVGAINAPDLVGYFSNPFAADEVIVPGRSLNTSLMIYNMGDAPASGQIAVEIYALGEGKDPILLTRQENVRINLTQGGSRTVPLVLDIPGQADPGQYSLVAVIDADNTIEEFLEDNNLVVADFSTQWVHQFGNVGSKKNIVLTLPDANGTPVMFQLRGNGYGQVLRDPDGHLNVTFYGTDTRSAATIRTPRGTDAVIRNITLADGSLRSLNARTTDIIGDILAEHGWIGQLLLDDIADDHVIVIGADKGAVNLTFGSVGDTSIYSAVGINRLTAVEWLDENDTPDEIVAPYLNNLRITGLKRQGVLGHFGADLHLSGEGLRRGKTLNRTYIRGDLYDVLWDIVGSMGNFGVGGIVENTSIRTTDSMGRLQMGAVVNSDFLAGITPDASRHAHDAGDFVNPTAVIQSVKVAGLSLPGVEIDPYFFENSNFSAAAIGRVKLLNLWADNNDEPFGFFALASQAGGGEIASAFHRDTETGQTWRWKPSDGPLDILDFTARILAPEALTIVV